MEHSPSLIKTFTKKISGIIPSTLAAKRTSIFKWLLIGIIIRFLVMPLFSHTDFITTLWISFTFASKNQLIHSVDPPAIFFVLGSFYKIMAPLFPQAFLSFLTSNTAFTPPTLLQNFSLLQPGINSVLLIGKIPYLLLDVASAFIILHLFNDKNKAFFAFKLWLLNPISIFVSYVFGQTDIFAVFFIILALYFLRKKKFASSVLSLSFAGVFKVIGLALIPLVAVYFWKTHHLTSVAKKTMKLGWLALLSLLPLLVFPVALSLLPQYYESVNIALPTGTMFNGFFGNTFYSMGRATQPFFSGITTFLLDFSISFQTQFLLPDFIYFVPFVYTIVFLAAVIKNKLSFEKTASFFTVFLLAYYAFSLFLPQWFLWIQPLLILMVAWDRKTFQKLYFLTIPLFFIYICMWDGGLTSNLLAPIVPSAISWAGPITLMIDAGLPAYELISIFRTMLSAVCVFTALLIIRHKIWPKQQQGTHEEPV